MPNNYGYLTNKMLVLHVATKTVLTFTMDLERYPLGAGASILTEGPLTATSYSSDACMPNEDTFSDGYYSLKLYRSKDNKD